MHYPHIAYLSILIYHAVGRVVEPWRPRVLLRDVSGRERLCRPEVVIVAY